MFDGVKQFFNVYSCFSRLTYVTYPRALLNLSKSLNRFPAFDEENDGQTLGNGYVQRVGK